MKLPLSHQEATLPLAVLRKWRDTLQDAVHAAYPVRLYPAMSRMITDAVADHPDSETIGDLNAAAKVSDGQALNSQACAFIRACRVVAEREAQAYHRAFPCPVLAPS